jgi:extracellular elastinolytic metalloproteinase
MLRSCLTVCGSVLVLLGVVAGGASAAPGFQGEHATPPDVDAREGRAAPSARQRALGSGLQVTWNRFGTPHSIAPDSGYLATGLSSDQVTAARQWIARNLELLGIDAATARDLEVVTATDHAVLLRQRFNGLPAGRDGLIAIGVSGGRVAYVSSSLAPDTPVSGGRAMGAAAAVRAAAQDARVDAGTLSGARTRGDWTVLDGSRLERPAHARLVAVPTPKDGVRTAWETSLVDDEDGFASFVDAETGEVLLREGLVDHLADNPTWTVFPNTPPMNYATSDTRVRWCWLATANCALVLNNPASLPWDVDARKNRSTFTTEGNNAVAVEKWDSNDSRAVGKQRATTRRDREYAYAWTNQWQEQRCNPAVFASPQRNDLDAALANLFAMHNRMHDWSYGLGFTEQTWNLQSFNFGRGGEDDDPEQGNAQAGGRSGGPPGFAARNNANQFTPADGLAPITNMYLWQPIPAGFYAPCVDGDYDMSVIAHEYGHAISNRMAGGPSAGLSGNQAQAMGESWSDLMAVQYLSESGFAPVGGENPFAVGPYVTGDKVAGIRNFGMNTSPLNYSDVGYDFVCNTATCTPPTQVHADGEIWSATNYDIRQAFSGRYGATGSRRWIQLVFDAWLLMATGQVSMIDARNALLAADQLRFNGVDHDIMWNAFARRGFGQAATTTGTADADPVPSFDSPHADEATVRFRPVGDAAGAPAQLFVGRYEARVTPIADTDPETPLGDTFALVPGTYEVVARADGFGHVRTMLTVSAGQVRDLPVNMPLNLASSENGATATGDGVNRGALIDDTEITNWASLGSPIAGKQVTVRLGPGSAQTFDRIQVSAMLRHRIATDANDSGSQSRFSALRQFELLACEARGAVDCTQDAQFTSVFRSPADAFPAVIPRPRAPDLNLRSFDVPSTRATHVRLRVLTNQCTGTPGYQGDQDDDPINVTDCDAGSTQDDNVRAAELQVFR